VKSATILLSGGLHSAVTLAIARAGPYRCQALTLDCGQRNRSRLLAARRVAATLGATEHRLVRAELTRLEAESPTLPYYGVLLSLALAWATQDIFIGVNIADHPDLSQTLPRFLHAFEAMANFAAQPAGVVEPIRIAAPLIDLTKTDIVRRGIALGVDFSQTVSCPDADEGGRACGNCDACRERRQAFLAAGVPDPTRYQTALA
jgi:7-cyano-7-deazaguanine synthase